MSLDQIQALVKARRDVNWKDERDRSPKAMGDFSGVMLSRVGSNYHGIQDFDYDLMSQIYLCNDLAWTCIDLVSSTVALGKLKVRQRTEEGIKYVPDHPLQKMLNFPNASMTQFDLLQAYITHQKLFGTVTILLLRENMLEVCPVCAGQETECIHKLYYWSEGPIAQMMPVHPTNIIQKSITLPDGTVKNIFLYTPEPGREYPIHPNNIMTDPIYNTDESWYGVSPTFLLKRWLDLDGAMTAQVTKFFENGAIPSLIINLKPSAGAMYDQEPSTLIETMKEKWMAQFGGSSKASRAPAFTYGDISVERLSANIEETISKGIYYEIQNRVCATYGVPPQLYEMGIRYGSQRSSAEQAEKDFYNRTISKALTRFITKLEQLVVTSYNDPTLELVWDLSDMGIASFLMDAKKSAIKRDWELGLISRDETRTLLGYEPVGGELGNDFYRLTVMSDGKNEAQAEGMDNRLKVPESDSTTPAATN